MPYTPLPIGIDDFEKLREENYYYVDKTCLIRELLDKKGAVNLFTRPRRFGKTLNLSMLKYFFEQPVDGKSNRHLFKGLKIMKAGENYTKEQEQYPVIMLTLKSARQPNWNLAMDMLKRAIASEYERHKSILEDEALADQSERYRRIMSENGEPSDYVDALKFLSECLHKSSRKKVIILIDEYDVPLENAYFRGFYEPMTDFIRSLFESALKTNDSLAFAVITGCLRISKESIFTGLNHLKVVSVLSVSYGEYFGFVEAEVYRMLQDYHREKQMSVLKEWYDGYRFGQAEVYNPWSVITYIDALAAQENAIPQAAWSNTSANAIVRELVEKSDFSSRSEIEALIAGGTIEKPVHEDITYEDIHTTRDNLWNFLFFTGYLKLVSQRLDRDTIYVTMRIPNAEVRYIYRNTIMTWFDQKLEHTDFTPFYEAMEQGDCQKMTGLLSEQLLDTISYFDYAEDFYHGFLAGVLSGNRSYHVRSNRESGAGRPDLLLEAYSRRGMAVIIELKISKKFQDLEKDCKKALQQIDDRKYEAEVRSEGYERIRRYGISFFQKDCLVMGG